MMAQTELPGVATIAVNGQNPSPRAVREIMQALSQVPVRFRTAWFAAGGRLEIIPGRNAAAHPTFAGNPPALGWTRGTFSVVAADSADARRTGIHELAHALDFGLGNVSLGKAWLAIWERDCRSGQVSKYADQREDPREYLAEMFCNLWTGCNGMYVSDEAAKFIAFNMLRT